MPRYTNKIIIIIIIKMIMIIIISDDPRETSFLFQLLSVSNQRFNSVCFYNSFGNLPAQLLDKPRRTWSFIVFLDSFSAFGNQVPRAIRNK